MGGTSEFSEQACEIVLWNDKKEEEIGRLTYKTPILNICVRKDYLAILLENKIYVHNWETLEVFDNFAIAPNPKGVFAMNECTDIAILVVPSEKLGAVEIHNYDTSKKISAKLHKNSLDILKISDDGSLLASASEMGNVIRVTYTSTCKLKKEFRTGADMSIVIDMAFSQDLSILAVSKTTGEIQIFM